MRWPETSGKPVCPHCECQVVYECRGFSGALRWRCDACRKDFTLTSVMARAADNGGGARATVLAANTPSRQMFRRLGFAETPDAGSPWVVMRWMAPVAARSGGA